MSANDGPQLFGPWTSVQCRVERCADVPSHYRILELLHLLRMTAPPPAGLFRYLRVVSERHRVAVACQSTVNMPGSGWPSNVFGKRAYILFAPEGIRLSSLPFLGMRMRVAVYQDSLQQPLVRRFPCPGSFRRQGGNRCISRRAFSSLFLPAPQSYRTADSRRPAFSLYPHGSTGSRPARFWHGMRTR